MLLDGKNGRCYNADNENDYENVKAEFTKDKR